MSATSNVARIPLIWRTSDLYSEDVPTAPQDRGQQFAALIRDARTDAKLTQAELAAQAGIDRTTIVKWESGNTTRPEPDQVRAVCKILGIRPELAAAALGFLDSGDIQPTKPLPPKMQQVLEILEDPRLSPADVESWINYLIYLRSQANSATNTGS